MDYDVLEAEYVSGYVIRLKFRDGTVGEIDLQAELWGPCLNPCEISNSSDSSLSTRNSTLWSGPTKLILLRSFCTTTSA